MGLLFRGELIECGTPAAIKAMVKGQVVELRAQPVSRARETLSRQPEVIEVQLYGDLLHVVVDDAHRHTPTPGTARYTSARR